jgi:hypothetical protein
MNWVRRSMAVCGIIGLVVLPPTLASGEWFADLYGGYAMGENRSVAFEQFEPTSISATRQLQFDASPTVGIRGGYWSKNLPLLGLAGDLSYFGRKAEEAELQVIPFSVLLMLRWPLLVSDEFPRGTLQPYIGFGPALFFSHASIGAPPPLPDLNKNTNELGLDFRIGLAWQTHKAFAMFSEYRFSDVTFDYRGIRCTESVCTTANTLTTSVTSVPMTTHHFLIGIRF